MKKIISIIIIMLICSVIYAGLNAKKINMLNKADIQKIIDKYKVEVSTK